MGIAKLSKTVEKPRTIYRKDIDEYLELQERRRALNREAAAIEKLEKELEDQIAAYVRSLAAGKVRSIERCQYRLSIVERAGYVSWKSEFLKAQGQAEVERLEAAAPKKDKLQVEKL